MSKPSNPHANPQNPQRQPAASSDGDEWVTVGEITGTFGLHGDIKVRPLTDFPERFERASTLYIGDQHKAYTVQSARLHKQQVVVHLTEVPDIESAERLHGAHIWIHSTDLMPLATDQYYLHDIIGLRVVHVNGEELGVVTDVLQAGASDIYAVRDMRTGAEVLLPAVKEFIKAVSLADGTITVDPIPGLFDEGYEEAR